jgi:hypothetical protein
VRLSGEPTPEGKAAERKLGEAVPEHVLTSAIGHREGMPDEEAGRRLRELVGPVLRERGTGVRRR